ncbi:hypothetical protein JOL79_23880 [Microbispora sp. RL4-1S]|uniref:Uncharacterized protein n=1 Tax=Microbispora oryzae TaxID=2806554 RepID=A0A940WTJ5_9ACTN|nr:hypothetical protein [Microbispora oryzae]MBP2706851.1 hypothetical protein [Microbispora oryzae]
MRGDESRRQMVSDADPLLVDIAVSRRCTAMAGWMGRLGRRRIVLLGGR